MSMKVFIQSNERQWLGALVSAYSLKRNSAHADEFDVEIMHVKDFPFLYEKEGQPFLRGGTTRIWRMSDLQSFTPLRFMPPKLMGHEGRAGTARTRRTRPGRSPPASCCSTAPG